VKKIRRPLMAALLTIVLHLPFVLRYDLHFQPDNAISMRMSQSILEGERPVFFWGQSFNGTGCNYATAFLFHIFGFSIVVAGLLSLGLWAVSVGCATAVAERLLGSRAALWAGLGAAVASPYANHYMTQPCLSYETAPLFAILVIASVDWLKQLVRSRVGPQVVASWIGLGLLLGLALWTTRLFLPALATTLLVIVLRGSWQATAVRRAGIGLALLLPALLVGASPEITYHLGGGSREPQQLGHGLQAVDAADRPIHGFTSLSQVPSNVLQGLRAVPAYFNGDPRARQPEGVAFALALWDRRDPYAGAEPGPFVSMLDMAVLAAICAICLAAAFTGVRAWRRRDLPVLVLCLTPLVHLILIGLSGQTEGQYLAARRYWLGSLLVFALLFGNAMAIAEAHPAAAVRVGARIGAGLLLMFSLLSQAQMLTLPDQLTDYRRLVSDLAANGERAVIMFDAGWIVAGLGRGEVDVLRGGCGRRPQMCARVLESERVALVLRTGKGSFPRSFAVFSVRYRSDGSLPRSLGTLRWRRYRRVGGSSSSP
jgi:hypothetical protein